MVEHFAIYETFHVFWVHACWREGLRFLRIESELILACPTMIEVLKLVWSSMNRNYRLLLVQIHPLPPSIHHHKARGKISLVLYAEQPMEKSS